MTLTYAVTHDTGNMFEKYISIYYYIEKYISIYYYIEKYMSVCKVYGECVPFPSLWEGSTPKTKHIDLG